ncbi:UNVERIFIED_CONTAM: hypothetical protein Sradi_3567800 [Sesamum radiatum]|uniref:Uncharacterized protein n=1 Tax=Sesamum radiatum TaxID=300843 RepID=A0AAW2QG01_SESRA
MEGWPIQEVGPKKKRASPIDDHSKEHTPLGQRESRHGGLGARSAWAALSQNRVRAPQLKSPRLLGLLIGLDCNPQLTGLQSRKSQPPPPRPRTSHYK